MANEYLQRTPTSSGNTRVFTFSAWVKKNVATSTAPQSLLTGGVNSSDRGIIDFDGPGEDIRFGFNNSSTWYLTETTSIYRDPSSWKNVIVSVNLVNADVSIYVNGIKQSNSSVSWPAIVNNVFNASGYGMYIGGTYGQISQMYNGEMFDVFWVDGQALTPDVFGFNKDGDGYISVGSTQATDFRNGQWVPRTPREIKNLINDNGGFGINGFYLPMNDSSNFGADFHTTPNSIITLKGEDLPQPRNGAPTTSDAYVSQLRTDPYAANLVLAVPGISTSTSSTLITNGTFDSNISGWTTVQATTSWQSGVLRIIPNASVNGAVYQSITTEVGKRYTVSMEVVAAGAAFARLHIGTSTDINSADKYTYTSGNLNNIGVGKYSTSFTPTTTTTIIWLEVGGGQQTQIDFDNVVVKQEDAPRDYSADIKGSGSNKTLTPNGDAGVGYELGNYYGSAMEFTGTTDSALFVPSSSDIDLTGDFTIEYWMNYNVNTTYGVQLSSKNYYNASNLQNGNFYLGYSHSGTIVLYSYNGQSNGISVQTTVDTNGILNQWNHVCFEREGNVARIYLNGVVIAIDTSWTRSLNDASNGLYIGKLSKDGGTSNYGNPFNGQLQDLRIYSGVAKYKGGFDVPKPFTPVGFESWRQVSDTCKNNFATLNSLSYQTTGTPGTSYPVLSDGNLKFTHGQDGQWERSNATMGVSEGKYYFEYEIVTRPSTANDNTQNWAVGLRESDSSTFYQCTDGYEDLGDHIYWIDGGNGPKIVSNQDRSRGYTYGVERAYDGDIINIAFEKTSTTLKAWFGINGTYFNNGDPTNGTNPAINHSTTTQFIIPSASFYTYAGYPEPVGVMNFGQNPTFSGQLTTGTYTDSNGKGLFKYQPPTGFLALCEDNLPTPAIKDPGEYFKTVLYEGDNSAGRRINVGFQPDFIWFKSRNTAVSHVLVDSVRGLGHLNSNSSNGEGTSGTLYLSGYADNGFDLNDGANSGGNTTGRTYVAWCWKAGGPAVTNTSGSLTSQVSANQTAGFSIVTYTGTASNATVGHGLGKKPSFILLKERYSPGNSYSGWQVYHSSLGATQRLVLDSTNAASTTSNIWNDTEPTSDVFSIGTSGAMSENGGTYVAYCWSEIEGFSKFGSWGGNGNADGPFVYCGFKPAFVLTKRIDSATNGNWTIFDSSRNSTNPVGTHLRADTSETELNFGNGIDIVSNGFKMREAASALNNASGTYIFAAFAESPFKTANAK